MLWCACELQAGCLLKVLRQALSSQHMLLVTSWHMRMSISLRYVLPDSLDSLDSCTEIQRKPDCKPDDWRVDESHNDSTQNCERAGEQTSPENFESPNLTTLRKKTDLDLQAKLAHKTQTSHVKHLRTAPRVYLLPFFQPQNHQQIDPFFHCCKVLTNLDPWKIWKLSPLHNEASRNLWQSEAFKTCEFDRFCIFSSWIWSFGPCMFQLRWILMQSFISPPQKWDWKNMCKSMQNWCIPFRKSWSNTCIKTECLMCIYACLCISMHFYAFLRHRRSQKCSKRCWLE